MAYVDGFVIVIPKKKLAAYRTMARKGGQIWKKYGALDYKECVLDDPRPKGVILTFPKLAKLKAGETVAFSYIVYKSKAHRNQVNAKVMKTMDEMMCDPKYKNQPMPFDMKRMAYGGFKVIVDA
jgi:alkaline phosphatase